jgi:hypothetical protein
MLISMSLLPNSVHTISINTFDIDIPCLENRRCTFDDHPRKLNGLLSLGRGTLKNISLH